MKREYYLVIIFLFAIAISYGVWYVDKIITEKQSTNREEITATEQAKPDNAIEKIEKVDPICGMKIQRENAFIYKHTDGKEYYFCMKSHLKEFKKNSEKYLKKSSDL